MLFVGFGRLEFRLVVRGMPERLFEAGAAVALAMLTWWCEPQGIVPNFSESAPKVQVTHSVSDTKLVPEHLDVSSW